jgi:hypothetical protein
MKFMPGRHCYNEANWLLLGSGEQSPLRIILWVHTRALMEYGCTFKLKAFSESPFLKRSATYRFMTLFQLPKLYIAWRTPQWSSGHSSWLQIQRSGFDSRRYHIFWEVVDLERGPFSLVSKIEELLERKCSSSGFRNRNYGRKGLRDP